MKGGFYLEIKDLPQLEEATESDHVVSSISQKTRLISFKNIFEKISFSSLVTTAKNIIGSINELKGRCDTLDTSVSKLNTDLSFNGFSIKCFTFVSTSDSGGYINIPYNGNNLTSDSCGGLFVCTVQSYSYINANNCFLNSNNVWRSKLTDNSGNPMIDKTINCIAIAFIKN